MSRPANPATQKLWRDRLDRFAHSGLNVATFCRRERISQPSFYQWRKKLQGEKSVRSLTSAKAKFLPLVLSAPMPAALELTLQIARDVRLSLPASLPRRQLTEVFAAALAAADEHAAERLR